MDIIKASKIVKNHPEIRQQMCELFETATDIKDLPDEEFGIFFCQFVEMAVENNPSLLD